jgi:tetratricopeptide (TPR) repeat protein
VADGLSAYLNGVQERLQAAQRERAVALAREAEQRKRRRVQAALAAAAVVALLVGGGAFAWWRDAQAQAGRERDARNGEAVVALLGQAEEALKAGDAAKAKVALEPAGKRSAEGGAEDQAGRLRGLEADRALLSDLDAVDQFRWTPVVNQFPDPAAVATRTREALARFGADPETVSADEAAARVSASVVRERIVAALDRLLLPIRLVDVASLPAEEQDRFTRQLRGVIALLPRRAGVRALLRRVDADPYRDAVRDAVVAEDRAKSAPLAGQPAALQQPPGFIAFLGESKAIAVERRRQLLQVALSSRPGDLGLLMTLGGTYTINQKDGADERLRWYQAAVAAAPANAAAHTGLGVSLHDKGQLDEAIACYKRAIELDPKEAITHYNLGNALKDKGQLDAAIACYQKVIELDPKDAPAHTGLGAALRDKGQVDEAITYCRKAIELDPKDAKAHANLGNALSDKGQVDEAIGCFKKGIALDPKLAMAHNNLGFDLDRKGQVDEAIACYKKAIDVDPKLARAHIGLGIALFAKGQLDEAIACQQKAIKLDPKDALAHTALGLYLFAKGGYGKGRVDEALAYCQKAIELDPKLDSAHSNLGFVLENQGQWDEALACYQKALALDPKSAMYRTHLARAQRMASVQGKLPALLQGAFKPSTQDERLALCE